LLTSSWPKEDHEKELTTSEIEYSRGAATSYFSPPWLVGNRLRKDRSNGSPSPVTFETQKMGHKLEEGRKLLIQRDENASKSQMGRGKH